MITRNLTYSLLGLFSMILISSCACGNGSCTRSSYSTAYHYEMAKYNSGVYGTTYECGNYPCGHCINYPYADSASWYRERCN